MATQSQISDWISRVRQLYADALTLFATYTALEQEARLTGRVVVTEQDVTTNLTAEQFLGANADVDPTTFINAFAALGAAFSAVDDADAALLYEVKA